MDLKHKTITIQVVRHGETGLLVALSDDLKGLYVHARTQDDLLDRIPVAIRDILEADGFEVVDISEIDIPPEVEAGFLPAQRKFAAKVGEPMSVENCPNCGGTHIGHNKCPFNSAPCVVCGEVTIMSCSDCAIETGKSVHVCSKRACRDEHERGNPQHPIV